MNRTLLLVIATIAALGAAGYGADRWWASVKAGLIADGETRERLKWEQRERQAITEAQDAIQRIRAEKDEAVGQLQARLAAAEFEHLEEVEDEKQKTERFIRDVRAGRVVLFDPGSRAAAGCTPGGGEGSAATTPAGGGNDQTRRQLSDEAAVFLYELAAEADAVVEQLNLAQDALTALYSLCRTR